MNNLSLHISKMNTLKSKISSVARGIKENDHNTFQNSFVKNLTNEEVKSFIAFFEKVSFYSAHFEITNISKNRIKILLITPSIERDLYNNEDIYLKKEIIRLKNIF